MHTRCSAWILAIALSASGSSLGCDRATVVVEDPNEPTPVAPPTADELVVHEAVRETVREYDAALAARAPERARELVVVETFAHYDELRRLALTASRDELERLDMMSVMLVLQLRNELSRAELDALDGRTLFDLSVADGLVGGGENGDAPLDEVWVDASGERAELRVDGQAAAFLRLVEGSWRMDIPATIQMLGQVFGSLARDRIEAVGKVSTALVLLEQSGPIDPTIADGPIDRAPSDAADDAAGAGSQSP